MNVPVFVVTGAPNKGKSTFLKAMTNDPNIEVGEIARTTSESKSYHFKTQTDGKKLMTLWDTPGFENAAEVYQILDKWGIKDSKNPLELIQQYIKIYKDNPYHKYEVEILKPLVNFSAIIYIADCSKRFSEEDYLREIQLLQFTNLPRIAILNPIDGEEHLDSWRKGLRRYFHNLKVFNPHKTNFEEKLSILSALSHLHDEWEKPISKVVELLKEERKLILQDAARIIRTTILKIYDKDFEIRFDPIEDEEENKKKLLSNVRDFVQKTMNDSQRQITERFGFDIEIELNQAFQENDLFKETVRKKNLSKNQRALIWGLGGASFGLAIDLPSGGMTFGIPTAIGGSLGYGAGYLSGIKTEDLINYNNPFKSDDKKVIRVKTLETELGFLVINRLRQVVNSLYNRTAANTDKIVIDKDLETKTTIKIEKLLRNISKSKKERYSESNKKRLFNFILDKLKDDQGL